MRCGTAPLESYDVVNVWLVSSNPTNVRGRDGMATEPGRGTRISLVPRPSLGNICMWSPGRSFINNETRGNRFRSKHVLMFEKRALRNAYRQLARGEFIAPACPLLLYRGVSCCTHLCWRPSSEPAKPLNQHVRWE